MMQKTFYYEVLVIFSIESYSIYIVFTIDKLDYYVIIFCFAKFFALTNKSII